MEQMLNRMGEMIKNNNHTLMQMLNETVDVKIEALKKELRAEIRAVEAKTDATNATVSSMSSGSGSAGKRQCMADRSAGRSQSAPPTAAPGVNPCRVWASGFPRKLLETQLKGHAEIAKTNMPEAMSRVVAIKAYNLSKSYSMEFPNSTAAADFVANMRTKACTWVDPKTNDTYQIKFRADRTFETRRTIRILGKLWSDVEAKLKENGKWDGKLTIGSTGPRGVLFLSDGMDVWELFTVKGRNGEEDVSIEVHKEQNAAWSISEEDAGKMVDSALADIRDR